jgi:hypothetical protein
MTDVAVQIATIASLAFWPLVAWAAFRGAGARERRRAAANAARFPGPWAE